MAEKINCIIKEPGKKARAHMIENTLEALQEAVGGYIETVPVMTDTLMIVNEEGKLRGLPHNFFIEGSALPDEAFFAAKRTRWTTDEIVGTVLIVGLSDNREELTDLDPGIQEQLLSELWDIRKQQREAQDEEDA